MYARTVQKLRPEDVIIQYESMPSKATVQFLMEGAYRRSDNGIKYISVSGSTTYVFEYKGQRYTLYIGDDLQAFLNFSTVDIRDETIKDIYKTPVEDVTVAVKQFWSNDTRVENYWWVDDNHVLAVTKADVQLWRKMVDSSGQYLLDDWNGDRWEIISSGPRGNYFKNEHLYYSVSCSFKTSPVLFRLSVLGLGTPNTLLKVDVLQNLMTNNWAVEPSWQSTTIVVRDIPYGNQKPPSGEIWAFSPIDIAGILSVGKISSTVIGRTLLIGIVGDRGLKQWLLNLNLDSLSNYDVLVGYGHVGHQGYITGGQIPAEYFDFKQGFNTRVLSIDKFEDEVQGSNDPDKVQATPQDEIYGTGDTQWFCFKQVTDIISHIIYDGTSFTKYTMPLLNKWTDYRYTERGSQVAICDLIPQSQGFVGLLTSMVGATMDPGLVAGLTVFEAVGLPSVFFIEGFMLQGILVQNCNALASYVWRNYMPKQAPDGKSDLDKSIIRRQLSEQVSIPQQTFTPLVALVSRMCQLAGIATEAVLSMNEDVQSQTISDTTGRKLGTFAMSVAKQAVSFTSRTDGSLFTHAIQLQQIVTLSQFYSIDSGTQCWAFPGGVNHQFIGQCVAQSAALAYLKIEKTSIYIPLEFLTHAVNQVRISAYLAAEKALEKQIEIWQNYTMNINPGGSVPVGQGIAMALTAAYTAVNVLRTMAEWFRDGGIKIMYAIIGSDLRASRTGGTMVNTADVEGTHTYGNKNMSLFWPCFGVPEPLTFEGETVFCELALDNSLKLQNKYSGVAGTVPLNFTPKVARSVLISGSDSYKASSEDKLKFDSNEKAFNGDDLNSFDGTFNHSIDKAQARIVSVALGPQQLPADMACVEGTSVMMGSGTIRNEQVNCSQYTFPAPPFQDYKISDFGASDKKVGVSISATMGEVICYNFDDTKLIDGLASNIIETDDFFGIASSYTAIELKTGYSAVQDYLRPWAITPMCIALNINKTNCVQDGKAYHGFDGQFNRIVSWKGGGGLDAATLCYQYAFQMNDHFKRSGISYPSEFLGNFNGVPTLAVRTLNQDRLINQIFDPTRQKGMDINTPGEDRDAVRYSLPVHSETLSTLPAVTRILAPYKLFVVDGITSLVTEARNTQTRYKAPSSVDFNLYTDLYRATEEYICTITQQDAIVALTEKTPVNGLSFIGATTKEAFFYSPATRMYYSFSGGDVNKKDIFNRFQAIKQGRWDFVNQEVVFKALLKDGIYTGILTDDVHGNIVMRLDKGVDGEIYPPNETIYNERSDFKILSMAGGLCFQGPKRHCVNRYVITDDMYPQIKRNKRKWNRLQRETWHIARDYLWKYEDWRTDAPFTSIVGWTHNPWRASTAMVGIDEETDCLFEWEITFAWTEAIDKLFEKNEFVSFNCMGETYTQGGVVTSRPTHIFLYKELFKNGYYTTRYQSKNGIGNRERLYLWGDGMTAIEDLACYTKDITKRRTQPLATSQVDVQELTEQ